jgi:hypothetical protein
MRNLSATSPRFPSTCARCGGVVAEPVSFCPHCGTHARLAFGREVPGALPRKNRSELPLADAVLESRPTPLLASEEFDRHGDIRPSMGGSSRQWGIKGGTAFALFAFALLYGGLVLLHRQNDSETRMQQSTLRTVEGRVRAGGRVQHDADQSHGAASAGRAVTPVMSTAPMPAVSVAAASSQGAQPYETTPLIGAAATLAQSATAPQSAQSAQVATPARSPGSRVADANDQVELPPVPRQDRQAPAHATSIAIQPAPGETRAERRPARAARFVEAARDSLAKNNLVATRRAIASALAAQPGNSEAFMLQQDLHSRERERDAALSAARACVVQQQWLCAWHNAGNALSIDSSSVEAKALVERAIIESGAAARPPGPGPDGPDVPMLTQ